MNYDEFNQLVNSDVRNKTSEAEADWLREDEQLVRFWKTLKDLERTVTSQLEQSIAAVNALPQGSGRRKQEEMITAANETKRKFYRDRVRDRIAEVEDLWGGGPLLTVGQVKLYLDAALDCLDDGKVKKAIEYLDGLYDLIEPAPAEVA